MTTVVVDTKFKETTWEKKIIKGIEPLTPAKEQYEDHCMQHHMARVANHKNRIKWAKMGRVPDFEVLPPPKEGYHGLSDDPAILNEARKTGLPTTKANKKFRIKKWRSINPTDFTVLNKELKKKGPWVGTLCPTEAFPAEENAIYRGVPLDEEDDGDEHAVTIIGSGKLMVRLKIEDPTSGLTTYKWKEDCKYWIVENSWEDNEPSSRVEISQILDAYVLDL